MGIFGLTSFIFKNKELVSEEYDLVAEAAAREGGLEILVDYNSFYSQFTGETVGILRQYWPDVMLFGGEYDVLRKIVHRLIYKLERVGIHLVFFNDGDRGCDTVVSERKSATWENRYKQTMTVVEEIEKYCSGHSGAEDVHEYIVPLLTRLQVAKVIADCGCKMFQSHGEADVAIAKYFNSNSKAFAILGNDSDFCVMKGCHFISEQWFDLEGDLELNADDDELHHVFVAVVKPDKVASALKLGCHSDLVEVSIFNGNDFTKPFVKDIKERKWIRSIQGSADWFMKNVKTGHKLEDCLPLKRKLARNKEFRHAVEFSRAFYNLELDESGSWESSSPLAKYLDGAVTCREIPCKVMAWYNGVFWHFSVVEDTAVGQPGIGPALSELRTHMYAIVKEVNDGTVTEFGRSAQKTFDKIKVQKSRVAFPLANTVPGLALKTRFKIFDLIASHNEIELNNNCLQDSFPGIHSFFESFGVKQGFICYIINYLLALSEREDGKHKFNLTREELLFVVTMTWHARTHNSSITSCKDKRPSIRCLSVGSWVQTIFYHLYLLAGLLRIDEEFPEAQDVYVGRYFVPWYMELQGSSGGAAHVNQETASVYETVVKENKCLNEQRRKYYLSVGKKDSTEVFSSFPVASSHGTSETITGGTVSTAAMEDYHFGEKHLTALGTSRREHIINREKEEEETVNVQTGNGELPVVKHKAAFLYHINKYRNTCIHVETGWGKSTQVPQFIMGDYNRNPNFYQKKPKTDRNPYQNAGGSVLTHFDNTTNHDSSVRAGEKKSAGKKQKKKKVMFVDLVKLVKSSEESKLLTTSSEGTRLISGCGPILEDNVLSGPEIQLAKLRPQSDLKKMKTDVSRLERMRLKFEAGQNRHSEPKNDQKKKQGTTTGREDMPLLYTASGSRHAELKRDPKTRQSTTSSTVQVPLSYEVMANRKGKKKKGKLVVNSETAMGDNQKETAEQKEERKKEKVAVYSEEPLNNYQNETATTKKEKKEKLAAPTETPMESNQIFTVEKKTEKVAVHSETELENSWNETAKKEEEKKKEKVAAHFASALESNQEVMANRKRKKKKGKLVVNSETAMGNKQKETAEQKEERNDEKVAMHSEEPPENYQKETAKTKKEKKKKDNLAAPTETPMESNQNFTVEKKTEKVAVHSEEPPENYQKETAKTKKEKKKKENRAAPTETPMESNQNFTVQKKTEKVAVHSEEPLDNYQKGTAATKKEKKKEKLAALTETPMESNQIFTVEKKTEKVAVHSETALENNWNETAKKEEEKKKEKVAAHFASALESNQEVMANRKRKKKKGKLVVNSETAMGNKQKETAEQKEERNDEKVAMHSEEPPENYQKETAKTKKEKKKKDNLAAPTETPMESNQNFTVEKKTEKVAVHSEEPPENYQKETAKTKKEKKKKENRAAPTETPMESNQIFTVEKKTEKVAVHSETALENNWNETAKKEEEKKKEKVAAHFASALESNQEVMANRKRKKKKGKLVVNSETAMGNKQKETAEQKEERNDEKVAMHSEEPPENYQKETAKTKKEKKKKDNLAAPTETPMESNQNFTVEKKTEKVAVHSEEPLDNYQKGRAMTKKEKMKETVNSQSETPLESNQKDTEKKRDENNKEEIAAPSKTSLESNQERTAKKKRGKQKNKLATRFETSLLGNQKVTEKPKEETKQEKKTTHSETALKSYQKEKAQKKEESNIAKLATRFETPLERKLKDTERNKIKKIEAPHSVTGVTASQQSVRDLTKECTHRFPTTLERRLIEEVCNYLKSKPGTHLLSRVANIDEIRAAAKELRAITSQRLKWIPFLKKHSNTFTLSGLDRPGLETVSLHQTASASQQLP